MMWSAIEPAEEKMPAMAWFFRIMLGVYVPGEFGSIYGEMTRHTY